MKKFMQKKLKNEKGMTLIELLAVIVILAIIAAIAIPAIGNIIENSRVGAMKSDNLNAIAAAELYLLDYPNATTVTLANLEGTTTVGAAATTHPAYIDDKGTLTGFTYTKSSKTVTSTAVASNMTLTIVAGSTAGATKAQISGYSNSNRTAANNITAAKTP